MVRAPGRRSRLIRSGLFVTGTDTGAGKSVLAAGIVAALRARGLAVRAIKPVMTGLDEPADGGWPHDHELLARVSGQVPEDVAPFRFGPAVSPHLAAELAGRALEPREVVRAAQDAAGDGDVAIVEGVGGLLVPLAPGYAVRDLARDLALPLLVAARPGLGTINHTLLTLEAARLAGLQVRGVVLTPWPAEPTTLERSNRHTIATLTGVEVATFPAVAGPDPDVLAEAASRLPLEHWLGLGA